MTRDEQKRMAARAAAKIIESGQRIGLGTGSTARHFLEALAERIGAGEITSVTGVPTSSGTIEMARSVGIPLSDWEDGRELELTVDGADEVDPQLDLLKGCGGALLREKIVAAASRRNVIIVDSSKLVESLGEKTPLPIEVLPFGWQTTAARIRELGGEPVTRKAEGRTVLTDQGNVILDSDFGPIADPVELAMHLEQIPGVLGHGLFLGLASEVIVGEDAGPRVIRR